MASPDCCRLCSLHKPESDFISSIDEVQEEDISLKNYISYYCRVDLSANPNRSRKVCRVCRLQLETFIAFCDNLNRLEKNQQIQDPPIQVKAEETKDERDEPTTEGLIIPVSSVKRRRTINGQSSMDQLAILFQKYLRDPINGADDFSHVTIDKSLLSKFGEIPQTWLDNYKIRTWSKIDFNCQHCNTDIKSLGALISHLRETTGKIKIRCPKKDCGRQCASLNSFINHVVNTHSASLAYSCIACDTMFYNTACLINHYAQAHPTIRDVHPCVECGYYALNHQNLTLHVMAHKTQEVSEDDDDLKTLSPCQMPRKSARGRKSFYKIK